MRFNKKEALEDLITIREVQAICGELNEQGLNSEEFLFQCAWMHTLADLCDNYNIKWRERKVTSQAELRWFMENDLIDCLTKFILNE